MPKGLNRFLRHFSPDLYKIGGEACHPARPGKQGCFLQKQQPSGGRIWKAQVGQIAICTAFLLNAPPFYFFGNCFSITLRNFTNFVMILIFLPQGYESLRIMYLLYFSFQRSYGNSRIAQKHIFSISATSRNFTDRASLLPFDF